MKSANENMSLNKKFGLKIYNYEAGSIYGVNLGITDSYDRTEAIFDNSLLCEFLMQNGLTRYSRKHIKDDNKIKFTDNDSGSWTLDIVCIKFNYGVKSSKEELKLLQKKIKKIDEDLLKEKNELIEKLTSPKKSENKISDDDSIDKNYIDSKIEKLEKKYKNKKDRLVELIESAKENEKKFFEINRSDLRKEYYKNGFEIDYDGKKIKYKMLYRTAGKAKEGSCIFINKKLYDKTKNFLQMGKSKFKDEESHIVEIGAYQSLVASSIVGKVKINPKNILVIKDVDVFFDRKEVVSVCDLLVKHNLIEQNLKNDSNNKKNTLFDGQALIDETVFNESQFFSPDEKLNGYILLRHHFCKMAAFCTDIKQFFKDYCSEHGKDYETFVVKDLWNQNHFAKDIELITTENSMKWMKFFDTKDDFDYWCKKVNENGNMFGIVKTAHESKFGNFQRMSFQMVNALDCDSKKMKDVVKCSVDYMEEIKQPNDDFINDKSKKIEDNNFIKFLKSTSTFFNDNDVLIDLCKRNRNFLRCNYFRDRKRQIISNYNNELKSGRIIQNAEYLVIVGSPYAMLLAAAGEDIHKDDMFKIEDGEYPAIQCYTERFSDGAELAEFRNPFNSKNNLGYLRNVYPQEKIRKYFKNFGKQIVAVNMIGTDFQARNNGSDQDSDSIYTTDQTTIVDCAKKCYKNYPTIINDIPTQKNSISKKIDSDILEKYAEIDDKLFNAKDEIGKASNSALLCLTYAHNENLMDKQKLEDYVCILSVLAQLAIDKAKHNFDIDTNDIINRIKKGMNINENKYPIFWKIINDVNKNKKKDSDNKYNNKLECPMNFVYTMEFVKLRSELGGLDMKDFFVPYITGEAIGNTTKKEKKVMELINKYRLELVHQNIYGNSNEEYDSYLLLLQDFKEMMEEIKKNWLGDKKLFSILIDRAFSITPQQKRNAGVIKNDIDKNKPLLLKVLYTLNRDMFLDCFKKEET